MEPATDVESQALDGIPDGGRAPDSASSAIESGQESIAGRVDFGPAPAPQLLAHGSPKVS
jgi:hypothetical protein